MPVDFRPIIEQCAAAGITIIEDCAHTLGGRIAGRTVGMLGDAAVFSFNYDKPISLGWGCLAVVNNPDAFDLMLPTEYEIPSPKEEIKLLGQFVEAMAMRRKMIPFQHSLAMRILRRVRLLKPSQFRMDPMLSVGPVQAELGCWCLANYEGVRQRRSENAELLGACVNSQTTWPVGPDVQPAWLKQKLLVKDVSSLRRLSARLQRRSLRAGNFNWPSLIAGCYQEDCEKSLEAATRWMDVPIHQNLDDRAFTKMVAILNDNVS